MTPLYTDIAQAWQQQFLVFKKNLVLIRELPSRETVHDLRVSIKHLRAYGRLLGDTEDTGWGKDFLPVSILFQTAAVQRDVEMSAVLLRRFSENSEYRYEGLYNFLQINIRFARVQLKKVAGEMNMRFLEKFGRNMEEGFIKMGAGAVNTGIKKITEGFIQKAGSLSGDFKKQAHTIRKILKDMSYYQEIALHRLPVNPDKDEIMENILQKLGNWQDLRVFLQKIKMYKKNYTVKGTDDNKSCDVLTAQAKNEIKELKEKSTRLIRRMLEEDDLFQ